MSRKIFNYGSVMLKDLTLEKEGHDPFNISKSSFKFIWATCRFCGKPSRIRKAFFKRSGSACHRECHIEEMKKQKSPFSNRKVWAKTEETKMKRFGSKFPSQNKEVAKKISLTRKITESKKRGYCGELYRKISEITDEKIIINDNKVISPLSLDIYIPKLKVAFCLSNNEKVSEYSLSIQEAKSIHKKKLDQCRIRGIYLFQIFEHQWISSKYKIMNFARTILGENNKKVPARKCTVDEAECRFFLDSNHIQGYGHGTIKYFNLIHDRVLVATMTASHHHRQNTIGNPIVLNRLCFLEECSVQGGASKLFKRFVEWSSEKGYDRIISFSDNAWTDGGIYNVLGFQMVREYLPDYFYWDHVHRIYFSKQSQKKSNTGCPTEIKERDWCCKKGLYRIWDCGKKLWEFKL